MWEAIEGHLHRSRRRGPILGAGGPPQSEGLRGGGGPDAETIHRDRLTGLCGAGFLSKSSISPVETAGYDNFHNHLFFAKIICYRLPMRVRQRLKPWKGLFMLPILVFGGAALAAL